MSLPTQEENPEGLHQRYYIQKITGWGESLGVKGLFDSPILEDTDEGAEYFVARLDWGGSDLKHIQACRIGMHAYADAIEEHLPKLAQDIRERYPLL